MRSTALSAEARRRISHAIRHYLQARRRLDIEADERAGDRPNEERQFDPIAELGESHLQHRLFGESDRTWTRFLFLVGNADQIKEYRNLIFTLPNGVALALGPGAYFQTGSYAIDEKDGRLTLVELAIAGVDSRPNASERGRQRVTRVTGKRRMSADGFVDAGVDRVRREAPCCAPGSQRRRQARSAPAPTRRPAICPLTVAAPP